MSIMDTLTILFAPDDCLICGREGSLLCKECLPLLPPLIGSCFNCRQESLAAAVCADCLAKASFDGLYVASSYEGIGKQLVAQLKFNGNQSAARIMATVMLGATGKLPRDALLINVPATAGHIRQRGYDQAALIAKQLGRLSGCPRASPLARSGNRHQFGADRATRLTQLAAVVRLKSVSLIAGRHIIIVDDVLTTGASISVAAQLLKAAGASRVDALVFAQA